MYRGYKNHLLEKDKTNKFVSSFAHINKCTKCKRLNPSLYPAELNNVQNNVQHNVQNCLFCGNPFYISKI